MSDFLEKKKKLSQEELAKIEKFIDEHVKVTFKISRTRGEDDLDKEISIDEKEYVSKPITKSIGYLSDLDLDSQQRLQKTIAEGIKENLTYRKLAKKIQAECNIESERAELISITELGRAYTNADVVNAKKFGVKTLIWNASDDDLTCEICSALDGEEIPIEEAFDCIPNRSHPRCRCYLTSKIEEE